MMKRLEDNENAEKMIICRESIIKMLGKAIKWWKDDKKMLKYYKDVGIKMLGRRQ